MLIVKLPRAESTGERGLAAGEGRGRGRMYPMYVSNYLFEDKFIGRRACREFRFSSALGGSSRRIDWPGGERGGKIPDRDSIYDGNGAG